MSKFSNFRNEFDKQIRKYQITLQQYHLDIGEINHIKYGCLMTKEELDEEIIKVNKRIDSYNGSYVQVIGYSVETVVVGNLELEGVINIEDEHDYTDITIDDVSLVDIIRHSYEGLKVKINIEVIEDKV